MTAAAPASLNAYLPTPDQLRSWGIAHAMDPHPILKPITAEALARAGDKAKRFELLARRHELVARELANPFEFGYEPDHWRDVDREIIRLRRRDPAGVIAVLIMGGNRAGKTEYASKRMHTGFWDPDDPDAAAPAIPGLIDKPGARVWCLHSTESASRQSQQPLAYKYMPPAWRPSEDKGRIKRGITTSISYSQKGGFSENTFVLPNASQCWFKFYSADVKTVEGVELDIAWADELIPLDWVDAVSYRLVSRSGILLITFTPVEGYTPTVRSFLDGASTVVEVDAELLPLRDTSGEVTGYEKVPVIQACKEPMRRVFYFHTKNNPYPAGNWASMRKTLEGKSRDEIKTRAYGLALRRMAALFPQFRDSAHIRNPEACPKPGDATWYHVVDPCNGRNFFMLWAGVNARGEIFVAREWPQQDDYIEGVGYPGEWAVLSAKDKADGDKGDAQEPFGFGLERYKEEIARVEHELGGDEEPAEIHERIMDSRFGNTPTLSKSEATTLIEEFADLGIDFVPAGGEHQAEGVELIKSALYYDPTREIGTGNAPKLYISSRCQNLIFALRTFTGKDGQRGACKDPIDCLRYLLLAEPMHMGRLTAHEKRRQQVGGY